jgi:hypothetical protein
LLKVLPGDFVDVRIVPGQLSEKVGGFQSTTAWQDASALTVISDEHPEIIGETSSTTVTLKEQLKVLPATSVAV